MDASDWYYLLLLIGIGLRFIDAIKTVMDKRKRHL